MSDNTNISFSGSIPEIYDRCLGTLLFEPYAEDLIERISRKKFVSVLEIACGTGRSVLAERFGPEAMK